MSQPSLNSGLLTSCSAFQFFYITECFQTDSQPPKCQTRPMVNLTTNSVAPTTYLLCCMPTPVSLTQNCKEAPETGVATVVKWAPGAFGTNCLPLLLPFRLALKRDGERGNAKPGVEKYCLSFSLLLSHREPAQEHAWQQTPSTSCHVQIHISRIQITACLSSLWGLGW